MNAPSCDFRSSRSAKKHLLIAFTLSWIGLVHAFAFGAVSHSGEAVHFLQKAIAAYDRDDFGGAKINLALALQAEPNFAEAFMLKGMLLARDGKTEEANAAFKRAVDLNPRLPEHMRERLETQAHDVEKGLTVQEFSHFRLQFHGAEERNKAWDAVGSLDAAYNELGSRFGTFPPDKIPVIIFSSQDFWEAWHAPMWLGGFFDKRDGKVRVRMDSPPGGEDEMKRRLRHEFTHAFIYQIYPKQLPMWFQEGVAQLYAYSNANDSFWKDTRLEELRKTVKGAPWLSMQQIQSAIEKKDVAPGLIYLAYLESEGLVLNVAKGHGDNWVPSLLQRLQAGASFDRAFEEVVGISPSTAMEQLKSSWR